MAQLPPPIVAVSLWVGLAVLTLAVMYVFEWRPRPDTAYGGPEDDGRTRPDYLHDRTMREAPDDGRHHRVLSHDEYDPVGTAILIAIYFFVISGLWLFMYFVEFLGSGPTVVG
ncbi:halocyanin [Halorientalis marina]|jgi:hypothetical protein|uniref:halocyanin n=1 Tax=Halorientalis marina TaxID=2931976 RepID=UPI001FF6D33F|nr:halocyanin [Halorientalis marina]